MRIRNMTPNGKVHLCWPDQVKKISAIDTVKNKDKPIKSRYYAGHALCGEVVQGTNLDAHGEIKLMENHDVCKRCAAAAAKNVENGGSIAGIIEIGRNEV